MAEGGDDSFSDLSDDDGETPSPLCDLESHFEKACEHLPSIMGKLDQSQLLYFYSRYKQAKEGPCNQPKPGFFDFTAKQKWAAWKSLEDMSSQDAMREYIDKMTSLDPDWDSDKKEKPKKMFSSGPVVSRMADLEFEEEQELKDGDKTVLDWVKEGQVDNVCKALPKSLDERDSMGMTLLHWACDRGHTDVVKCLLEKGANINLKDEDGLTALHYASSCGHEDVVRVLLEHNADTTILNDEGATPADIALAPHIVDILNNYSIPHATTPT